MAASTDLSILFDWLETQHTALSSLLSDNEMTLACTAVRSRHRGWVGWEKRIHFSSSPQQRRTQPATGPRAVPAHCGADKSAPTPGHPQANTNRALGAPSRPRKAMVFVAWAGSARTQGSRRAGRPPDRCRGPGTGGIRHCQPARWPRADKANTSLPLSLTLSRSRRTAGSR